MWDDWNSSSLRNISAACSAVSKCPPEIKIPSQENGYCEDRGHCDKWMSFCTLMCKDDAHRRDQVELLAGINWTRVHKPWSQSEMLNHVANLSLSRNVLYSSQLFMWRQMLGEECGARLFIIQYTKGDDKFPNLYHATQEDVCKTEKHSEYTR